MGPNPEPYRRAQDVETAIREAARRSVQGDPSVSVKELVTREYFNRFLSRVFYDPDSSEWILKGGTGMLARVPSARATRDIDLFLGGHPLLAAVSELRQLVELDLGDFFRFEYQGHQVIVGGDTQPYTEGASVKFDVYVGVSRKTSLTVDVVTDVAITGTITMGRPKGAAHLPRLVSRPYRLYPVVDQVADKVCATLQTYGGRPSSREKDLVDLVILTVTEDIDGAELRRALVYEAARRHLHLTRFSVPDHWGAAYTTMAGQVPQCSEHQSVKQAERLIGRLVDPAIAGKAIGQKWLHIEKSWQ